MISDLRIYLEDLDSKQLPKKNGIIVADGRRIKKVSDFMSSTSEQNSIYSIDGTDYYGKSQHRFFPENCCANSEVVMSKVYNDLGIPCADYYPIYMMSKPKVDIPGEEEKEVIGVVCQDLNSLFRLAVLSSHQTLLCKTIIQNIKSGKVQADDYWSILKLKSILVGNVMDINCFNNIVNMLILDTATMQKDRNFTNFFLYKRVGEKLWEGAVAIDNSYSEVNKKFFVDYDQICLGKSARTIFDEMMLSPYVSSNLNGKRRLSTHRNNLRHINKLLFNGELNKVNADFIRKIHDYDMSSAIEEVERKRKIKISTTQKDLMNYVWEYSQNSLEV